MSKLIKLLGAHKTDVHLKEILSGAGMAFALRIVGVAFLFLINLLLARTFGAERMGLYFLALSIAELLNSLGAFGSYLSIVSLFGSLWEKKYYADLKGALVKSILLVAVVSLTVCLLTQLGADQLEKTMNAPGLSGLLAIFALAVPFMALMNLFGGGLRGLQAIRDSQFTVNCSHPMFMLVLLIPVFLYGGIREAAFAYLGAGLLAAASGWFLLRRATPQLKDAKGSYPLGKIVASNLPLLLTNLCMVINARSGAYALGYWSSTADLGIFNIALRVSLLTSFPLMAVNAISAPKFAAMHGQSNHEGLQRIFRQSTAIMLAATLPVLLIIFLMPELILSFFGAEFVNGKSVLIVLALGQLFNIAAGPVGMMLAMTGNEKSLRNAHFISLLVNVVLLAALVPGLGMMGAAYATTASVIFVNIVAVYLVKKKLGISLFRTGKMQSDKA